MYPEEIVTPMRKELTSAGFTELRTSAEVDQFMKASDGTTLVVVNSICGCAAGAFRPGIVAAVKAPKKPVRLATVFAGQDKEATDKARSYFHGYPPSSPSAALIKNGEVVFMLDRQQIEGYSPAQVAAQLQKAFEQYC